MTNLLRNKALLVLLLYVPVLLTVEMRHTHGTRSFGAPLEVSAAPEARTVSHEGICFSCLFAVGHLAEDASHVVCIAVDNLRADATSVSLHSPVDSFSSPRGPPCQPSL